MGRIPININGKELWTERNGPGQFLVYQGEFLPYSVEVCIPPEYQGFIRRYNSAGKGSSRAYDHSVPWLVANVPQIQEDLQQKLGVLEKSGV